MVCMGNSVYCEDWYEVKLEEVVILKEQFDVLWGRFVVSVKRLFEELQYGVYVNVVGVLKSVIEGIEDVFEDIWLVGV